MSYICGLSMEELKKNTKPNTPKRIGASIKKDAIKASDYLRYNLPNSCEECSHFNAANETCTLSLPTEPHLERSQKKSYLLSGKIAICRFQEID